MMNKIIKIENYLLLKKDSQFTQRDKKTLEWNLLSALQTGDEQNYNKILHRVTNAELISEFYEILDRVAMTEDGTFYVQKPLK